MRYSLNNGVKLNKSITKKSLIVALAGVFAASLVALPVAARGNHNSNKHHNHAKVVYDNIPGKKDGNVLSVNLETSGISEFGGGLDLDGKKRKNPTVSVLMSSWACKSGKWQEKDCITNPGSKFTHPVTLNVYEVGENNEPGDMIATKTKTFKMPYRPTADDGTNCQDQAGAMTGEWWNGKNCYNGKAFKIHFHLKDVTLPDNVILGVSYNTTHTGVTPLGEGTECFASPEGCPYDLLNIGTNPTPKVGTPLPTADDAYVASALPEAYCDDAVAGLFRLDAGCWTGQLPAFEVSAESGKGHHNHHYKKHKYSFKYKNWYKKHYHDFNRVWSL